MTLAEQIMRQRDARSRVFGDLREAAFLIIVGLWLAEQRGKRSNVASACLDARAPATTVNRHLATLEAEGLIERTQGDDRRMQWLTLTDKARLKLGDFVRQCGADRPRGGVTLSIGPPELFSCDADVMRILSVARG